jgi:predicted amidohydrolase
MKGAGGMAELTLGLVQMKCQKGALGYNIISMYKYLEECKEKGAEIVCFPEMNITGYIDPVKFPEAVISKYHSSIQQVADMSFTYQTTIIAGFAEKNYTGLPFITQLAAQDGKISGCYRKRTISSDEKGLFYPGTESVLFSHMGIGFGIAICADIDNDEIFREYGRQGARLVFLCAAPGLYGEREDRDWESGYNWWKGECNTKLSKYAAENSIYIAATTQAGRTEDEDFPGGGYVFDPQGNCICETEDWHEGILIARIKLL